MQNVWAWQARQREQAAEAAKARREDEVAEEEARREQRRAAGRKRYHATKPPPKPRRGYAASKMTNARRSERVRQHRFARAVAEGTASPLAMLRNDRKLTQRQLATAAGTSRNQVEQAENGGNVNPDTWARLADVLGVPERALRP